MRCSRRYFRDKCLWIFEEYYGSNVYYNEYLEHAPSDLGGSLFMLRVEAEKLVSSASTANNCSVSQSGVSQSGVSQSGVSQSGVSQSSAAKWDAISIPVQEQYMVVKNSKPSSSIYLDFETSDYFGVSLLLYGQYDMVADRFCKVYLLDQCTLYKKLAQGHILGELCDLKGTSKLRISDSQLDKHGLILDRGFD